MAQLDLSTVVDDVASLRGIFITAMPDCLLFDSWVRDKEGWEAEEVASYFGDLIRSNRQGLKALGSWSADMQVTIESADTMLLLREIGEDFVAGMVFDRDAPLGMVRLHLKRVLERLTDMLPKVTVQERARGVRVVEFLQRYSPDPHASLMRVSLQTGLELEVLEHPENLTDEEVTEVETSVCDVLGLDSLQI